MIRSGWLESGPHHPDSSLRSASTYRLIGRSRIRAPRLRENSWIAGVSGIEVDEVRNRIKISVVDRSSESRVREQIAAMGVPQELVTIAEMPYGKSSAAITSAMSMTTTLQQLHPQGKIEGGWRVAVDGPVYPQACTIGFGVLDPGNYTPYFITNSHCTSVRHGVDGDSAYQSYKSPSTYIGREVADASSFWCYAGTYNCRHADVAQFEASADVRLGSVARTVERQGCENCYADLTLAAASQLHVRARNSHVFANEVLEKVGQTSGWTYGAVEATCVDYYTDGVGVIIECSDRVDFSMHSGDSGSPVFKMLQTGFIELRGIAFGTIGWPFNDAMMSDLHQIELDLGSLLVFEYPATAFIEGAASVPPSAFCEWTGFALGRPPFQYEWRHDGVAVSNTEYYSVSNTGTTNFDLSFRVIDARADTSTAHLSVEIDFNDIGIICTP